MERPWRSGSWLWTADLYVGRRPVGYRPRRTTSGRLMVQKSGQGGPPRDVPQAPVEGGEGRPERLRRREICGVIGGESTVESELGQGRT